MALTYQLETNQGRLQVRRRKTLFNPDGSVRTSKLHCHVISPGQDYSAEPRKIRRLAAAFHTPEVIQAYQDQQALDPDAPPAPLIDGETDIVEVIIREDDYLEICKCTEIIEDGELYEQHFKPVIVPPGVPVSNAPDKVTAMLAAAHIPTVVARYEAEQAYEAAKERLSEAISVRDSITPKVQYQILLARALLAEIQAKLDADTENEALIQKKTEQQTVLDELLTLEPQVIADVLQAEKDVPRLLKKRNVARIAYDVFEAG